VPGPGEREQEGTYHDIERNQKTRLGDRLADVMSLPEGQSTTDGSTSGRSDLGVERIDVEREVDGTVFVGVHVVERHLDDFADSPLVDVEHGEALDV
jgi:hypothetical protein